MRLTANNSSPPEVKLTTISIASFNLPIFDEVPVPAIVPAFAQYEHSYSLKWSSEMAKYDGYIVVTPEYNSGPPGSVKNAFDYLYHELEHKPIMIVSYGRIGGKWASESLARSFASVAMRVVETRPMLPYSTKVITEYGFPLDLQLAGTGVVGEDSLKEWMEKTGEFIKGFEELKVLLAAPKN